MPRTAPLSALMVVGAVSFAAADDSTRYTVMGNGAESCADWATGRELTKKGSAIPLSQEGSNYTQRNSWLLGYLTAMNRWFLPMDRGAARAVAEHLDPDALLDLVDAYCASHAQAGLDAAAEAIGGELSSRWLRAHPLKVSDLEKALGNGSALSAPK